MIRLMLKIMKQTIDISDVNISSNTKRNIQQLQKDFKKMNESIGRKVTVKEVVKWMKKLEEYRYRKVKSVDARREHHS